MNDANVVRGYRIRGDVKPDKQLNVEYLKQSHEAAVALDKLWEVAAEEEAPCRDDPDAWTPDALPRDKTAQLMCASCPMAAFKACRDYAEVAHPAWGIYAGRVWGRALEKAMRDDD